MPTTISDAPYLVTETRAGDHKLHRATCKKALVNASAIPTSDWAAGHAATCCKPRPIDVPDVEPEPAAEPVVAPEPASEPVTPPTSPRGKRAPSVPVTVRFVRNGKPMPDSQNKLASVAYYHTKDVEPGAPRCTTQRLREILSAAGVDAPETTIWGPITLTNGVVLGTVPL